MFPIDCFLGLVPRGKFRHLPVLESGEVIVLLDTAKFLYDAIAANGKGG